MDYLVHFEDGSSAYLAHHGVKGMKWGVWNEETKARRTGALDIGIQNVRNARNANLESWGKSANTNVMYVTGYSGSGKSTAATSLAGKHDRIIRLDAYFEKDNDDFANLRDPEFNKHLDKTCPKWREMRDASRDGSTKVKKFSKEYWDIVDNFDRSVESFGKEQFAKGRKVIAEGVQIADGTLKKSYDDYKGKPISILSTGPVKSMRRAFDRDERGGLLKGLGSMDSTKEYAKWYFDTRRHLNDLSTKTSAKRGKRYVDNVLKM